MCSVKLHLGDELELFKSYNTDCKIIGGGMIQLVQFIDTYVKLIFSCLTPRLKIIQCFNSTLF